MADLTKKLHFKNIRTTQSTAMDHEGVVKRHNNHEHEESFGDCPECQAKF